MIQISDNTQQIQPSKIRKMFNKALEYDHVISFTLGEPDFTASPNVVEAGCRAIREGKTKYSENAGLLALRQAIAAYLHRTEGLSYDPASQIVVTPGAMGALFLALKVLLNPGDEVIVNEPCWTNYVQQIRMCGGVPVSVKTNAQRGFDLDVSAIAEAVTDKTKAIILNSPCNPTGAVASTETLLQLAELAQKQDLVILADEVYKHILFDGRTYTSFAALPGMKERTLVIDSLSKTYAMTGWRIGYAAGPENVIRNMVKLQENVSACAATPCQVAAIEALEGPQDHLKYMVEQYRLRRDYVMRRISEIPGLSCHAPAGTFYAFIDISQLGMPCEEFAMKLLEERQVVVVPGTAFGEFGEGYIRLSYATSMQCLEQGLQELEEFVRSHKTEGGPRMSMINGTRLYDHLTRLGRIGFVPKEGTTRLPYTPAYDEGRIYVQQCMEQAGLQTSVDPVGNLIGTLPGQGEIICIGSHIDTVPGGGIYDGTYGVLSGIECVQRLKELGYQNRHPIQVIAFTEEEGNVIGGTFGSKAFTGGEIDEAMRPNLALHGLTMEQVGACRRDLTQYQCYLELHIEQGGVLEAERMQIGVVDGIVGIVRYRMTVSGCANHAGSTPMHLRDDALVKACRIITQLMERTEAASPDMVCTVGTLQVFPGAVNVIPGKVEFIVELRNPTMEPMDQVIDSVLKEHPELVGEEYIRQSPTQCSSKLIKLSETLCRNRGIRFRRMFSGAGHDLMNWGKAVPSMLLFIPSKDGISHSIREYSAPEDLYQGADLLMEMVQALDQEEGKL